MSAESCPICTSTAVHPKSIGAAQLLECSDCTAVFTPTAKRAQATEGYYEDSYSLTSTVRASTEMHRYFRYPEYIRLLGEIQQHRPPPGTWLDVGCDHGFFLDEARRFGYDTLGVEPSEQARTYARHIGLDVRHDVSDITESIDVASMWHVLEHLQKPTEVLLQLHAKMNSGGLLVVRVPDAGSFWARVLRDKWIWFQPHHHVVQYTSTTLRKVVEGAGFNVKMMRSQYPNTYHTKLSYSLATSTFASTGVLPSPSLRDRLARQYQDITGKELFLIAERL